MRLRHRIELLQKLYERLMDGDENGMASVVGLSLDELRAESDRKADFPSPQQESATVADMRDEILRLKKIEAMAIAMIEGLDDKLEAAEQNAHNLAGEAEASKTRAENAERDFDLREAAIRVHQARIAELEQQAIESEVPINFGQQCYQDRCENAYVEASVVKMLEKEIAGLRAQLESRQPAPSRQVVDREEMGRLVHAHINSGHIERSSWRELDAFPRDQEVYRRAADAVIAAYETQKGAAGK